MVADDITPTRSVLIDVRRKIVRSQMGYNLLKKKRDGLFLEFREILDLVIDAKKKLQKSYNTAYTSISVASAMDGAIAVKSAALSMSKVPQIDLQSKNIMGVVVPVITAEGVRSDIAERGYGIIGTSSLIDEATSRYEELLENLIVSAELESTLKKLLREIESTKRRVNALEFKVIPDLLETKAYIAQRLEEMEREATFRLKRFKAKSKK